MNCDMNGDLGKLGNDVQEVFYGAVGVGSNDHQSRDARLVPRIHVFFLPCTKPWMAGTSRDKPGHDGVLGICDGRNLL
jgi:hypothetical protein